MAGDFSFREVLFFQFICKFTPKVTYIYKQKPERFNMNFKHKFISNDIHISNKNKILETGL